MNIAPIIILCIETNDFPKYFLSRYWQENSHESSLGSINGFHLKIVPMITNKPIINIIAQKIVYKINW